MNRKPSSIPGNTWDDQDEAFFGSKSDPKTNVTFCKPCHDGPNPKDDESLPLRKDKILLGMIDEHLQKEKIIHLKNAAVAKLGRWMHDAKAKVETQLNLEINMNKNRNIRSNTGGSAYPHHSDDYSSNIFNKKMDVSISDNVCRTSNRSNFGRLVQNALVSQVPLRCAHCHSVPFMYHTHPFFGPSQRICSTHPLHSVTRCVSCQRFQPKDEPFAQIGTSSARICAACARTAILDHPAVKQLYRDILLFMESKGLEIFHAMYDIPIRLVDEDTMNQNSSSIGCNQNEQKRGLCVWSEQHVGLPRVSVDIVHVARNFFHGNSREQSDTSRNDETQSEIRRNPRAGWRSVTIESIYILKGLPRNLMASVLAHESTHAWLGLNPIRRDGVVGEDSSFGTIRKIDQIVEEGICQLMAYLYLEHIAASTATSDETQSFTSTTFQFHEEPTDSKLNEYYAWSIENHASPIYGGGFHSALRAYKQVCENGGGLKELMDYIVIHREFPPP